MDPERIPDPPPPEESEPGEVPNPDELEPLDEEEPQNIGDILELDPAKMAKLRAKKIPTFVAKVRLFEVDPETMKKTRIPGEFAVDEINTAWLQRNQGPGRYQVIAFNKRGEYLAATIVDIAKGKGKGRRADDEDDDDEPSGRGFSRLERLLEKQAALLEKVLTREPPKDPIRDSIAAMATMFQAQAAAQMQSLEMQMKVRDHMTGPNQRAESEAFALAREVLNRQATAPVNGQAPSLDLLKLGLALGARMNGGPGLVPTPKEKNEWIEFASNLSDTIGVPLVATFAQGVLPPDKANQVLEAINSHLEARKAEAEADAAAADDDEGDNDE